MESSNVSTPTFAGKQMSSSLKERLKRCGRYHASPSPLPSHSSICSTTPVTNTPVRKQISNCNIRLPLIESPAICPNTTHLLPSGEIDATFCKGNSPYAKRQRVSYEVDGTEKQFRNIQPSDRTEGLITEVGCGKICAGGERKKLENCKNTDSDAVSLSVQTITRSEVTPLRSRSYQRLQMGRRSIGPMLKGSKLNFESTSLTELASSCVPSSGTADKTREHQKCTSITQKSYQTRSSKKTFPNSSEKGPVKSPEMSLKEKLRNAEEELRQLRIVKMYRSKNNLDELEMLISKWRGVSQQGLLDLHGLMSEPKPSLTQLLDHLGIEHQLVKYDADSESFDT